MKLSIITVNKNNAAGLRKTIESVVCQTYKDFEYIIIDGASTDESTDIIKKHSEGINYWISEPDNGIYYAMNNGIRIASGEYCLFLNSGDYLFSDSILEKAFNHDFFEDIVYGDWINENHLEQRIVIKFDFKLSLLFFLEKTNSISHQNSFIKKNLLIKLSLYRLDFKIASDLAFFVEALYKYGATFRYIPIAISVYNRSGTSSDPKNIALLYNERNRIFLELLKYPPLYESIKSIAFYDDVWNTPGVKFWHKTYLSVQNFIRKIKRLFGKDFYHNISKFFEETKKVQRVFAPKKIRIPKNKKLLVWGAGADSTIIYDYCYERKIFVYAFLDSSEQKQKYALNGRPVFTPNFAFENKTEDFFIVVASRDYCEEISNTCREKGLKEGMDFCVPFESVTAQ
jgi:glycosyltransferase involved in cell wall biosynthesis